MPNVERTVQQKLNLKWVEAQRLVEKATHACEILDPSAIPPEREEEVITEACEIFADLDEAEQNRMKLPSPDSDTAATEPEWKRKAREQAERREAEWQAKEAAVANNDKVREKLREHGVPEEEVQGTRVIAVRKVQDGSKPPETSTEPGKGTVRIRTHTCYCVIQ